MDRRRSPAPVLVALAAAAAILVVVYPGFMSYDSLRALHEARTGVLGGDYPPFVSYVWRVLDAIWPGPALMLFVQNFVLVLGFAMILRTLGYPDLLLVAGTVLFCVAPPILGPMFVVWKDVGVSACLCSAVACFLAAESASKPRLAIAAGIVLLFAGAAYRLNAITAVVPLVAWYAWRGGFAGFARGRALVAGAAMLAGIALAVAVVNGVRFPELTRLPPPRGLTTVMVHDLVAMSALTGRTLVPQTRSPIPADQIAYFRRIYDPRHVNLVTANDVEGRLDSYFALPEPAVRSTFLSVVCAEPWAYLGRRMDVFLALVGFPDGRTYLATHVGVDANEEGVVHRRTQMTAIVLHYLWVASGLLPGKPWLYYLLGAGAFVVALLRKGARTRGAAAAIFASGVLYLLPLFFVTPAADVRYNHWALVCAFIVIAIACRPVAPRDRPTGA